MPNIVFIATSTDGFIATKEGGIEWLMEVPNPDNSDFGFNDFMESIDALVMGRKTYEKVLSFECDWPYKKKVFVLSNTLKNCDPSLEGEVEIVNGPIKEVINRLNHAGYNRLYIDGGMTIQNFLEEDLIDEMIITVVPVTLGEGIPLFRKHHNEAKFKLECSEKFKNEMVKNYFKKISS